MNIAFRVDASLEIGSGHVMRCLTLADAVSARGASCRFICRLHEGNLIGLIRSKGYLVNVLPASDGSVQRLRNTDVLTSSSSPKHADWLGVSQEQDAAHCVSILEASPPDWLIVDHYAIDARWEESMVPHCRKLMAIDDLADRVHVADLLLDQNLGHVAKDYDGLVPATCIRLIGPRYALLRPEFQTTREASLARRLASNRIRHILISMGGMDFAGATSQILDALVRAELPTDTRLSVVMGSSAPALERVRAQATKMPWPTAVLVDVGDMARLMYEADLAIGAGGSTAWERCCLGLPSIVVPVAPNQDYVSLSMATAGSIILIRHDETLNTHLRTIVRTLVSDTMLRQRLVQKSAAIVDGHGCRRIVDYLE